MTNNSLRILKDVLLRYMEMAKACQYPETVAKIIQRFKRAASTQNRPRVGRPKKHVLSVTSKCFLWKIGVGVLSTLLQRLKKWGVSLLVLRPYAALYIKLVCRRKPLLKTIHKRAAKQFAEDMSTKQMYYWNHILWSDVMKINLFDSDGFKHVWRQCQVRITKISVSCLQSSMVGPMSWSNAAWVLKMLESYISFRETWTPTCTVKYCSRVWSPPSRNCVAGQCSSMTMTPNTPPRRPLLYWRGWG